VLLPAVPKPEGAASPNAVAPLFTVIAPAAPFVLKCRKAGRVPSVPYSGTPPASVAGLWPALPFQLPPLTRNQASDLLRSTAMPIRAPDGSVPQEKPLFAPFHMEPSLKMKAPPVPFDPMLFVPVWIVAPCPMPTEVWPFDHVPVFVTSQYHFPLIQLSVLRTRPAPLAVAVKLPLDSAMEPVRLDGFHVAKATTRRRAMVPRRSSISRRIR
jgi:hypothetical protein